MFTRTDVERLANQLGGLWLFGDAVSIYASYECGLLNFPQLGVVRMTVSFGFVKDTNWKIEFLNTLSTILLNFDTTSPLKTELADEFYTNLCFFLKDHEDFMKLVPIYETLSGLYPDFKQPAEVIQGANEFDSTNKIDIELIRKVIITCSDLFDFETYTSFSQALKQMNDTDAFKDIPLNAAIEDVRGFNYHAITKESYLLYLISKRYYRTDQKPGFAQIGFFIPVLLLYLAQSHNDQSKEIMELFGSLPIGEDGKNELRTRFPLLTHQI